MFPLFNSSCLRSVSANIVFTLCLLIALVLPPASQAERGAEVTTGADMSFVPPVLAPWVNWVRERKQELKCPLLGSESVCLWAGLSRLELNDTAGTFSMRATVFKFGALTLPGGSAGVTQNSGETLWPLEVKIEATEAERGSALPKADLKVQVGVHSLNNRPVLYLAPGEYVISGRFSWKSLPRSILLPPELALVSIKLNGNPILNPPISESGELWLENQQVAPLGEQDALQIKVYRRVSDALPLRVDTSLQITASGKAREVNLGKVLLDGTEALEVRSLRLEQEGVSSQDNPQAVIADGLAYRFDSEWNLILQLKPGHFELAINAVARQPEASLKAVVNNNGFWPEVEYWAFRSDESFRTVELSGAPNVDAQIARVPQSWRGLPTYLIKKDTSINIKELRRGELSRPDNQIHLSREAWLDLDGQGFTLVDSLSGIINKDWRLNMSEAATLSKVEIAGERQLITEDPGSKKKGLELRNHNLSLTAISRLERRDLLFPAVAWDQKMISVTLDINIGPGWEILSASGADEEYSTWISRWSMWTVFLVGILAGATRRLFSWRLAVLMLISLVLSYHESFSPLSALVLLLIAIVLARIAPEGFLRRLALAFYLFSGVYLLGIISLFSYSQIVGGLYPQLKPGYGSCSCDDGFIVGGLYPQLKPGSETALFNKGRGNQIEKSGLEAFQMQSREGELRRKKSGVQVQDAYDGVKQNYGYYEQMPGAAPIAMSAGGISSQEEKLETFDPKAVVQTGVAKPDWHWKKASFRWNRPVDSKEGLTLLLISPLQNLLLSFLRVGLILLLLFALFKSEFKRFKAMGGFEFPFLRASRAPAAKALIALALIIARPGLAFSQDYPSPEMLEELGARLEKAERLERESCKENCVELNELKVVLDAQRFTFELSVSSRALGGLVLPGPLNQFSIESVTVNGAPVREFRRVDERYASIWLASGSQKIEVKGQLLASDNLSLSFVDLPRHVEVEARDWLVSGLSPVGSVEGALEFARQAKVKSESLTVREEGRDLAEWYELEREIYLGLNWSIRNRLKRLGGSEKAKLVRVPLLKGEAVTDSGLNTDGEYILLSFAKGQSELSWNSSFKQEPKFSLIAEKSLPLSEQWVLRCASIWQCSWKGLRPTNTISESNPQELRVSWRPFPGESTEVQVLRPLAAEGISETISSVSLNYNVGDTQLEGNLSFSLLSAQGGRRVLTLPEGAQIKYVYINNRAQNISLSGRELSLPLVPGEQNIQLSWTQAWTQSFLQTMPEVNLGGEASNIRISANQANSRWLLALRGPDWGPVVRVWGWLIFAIIVSAALARFQLSGLSFKEWFLLTLGIVPQQAELMVWPIAFFVLLEIGPKLKLSKITYRLFQAMVITLAVITLGVFLLTIYDGLMDRPDMKVGDLNWYSDRGHSEQSNPLPSVSLLSLPIWYWRVFMLAWSSWLSSAFLRWIRLSYSRLKAIPQPSEPKSLRQACLDLLKGLLRTGLVLLLVLGFMIGVVILMAWLGFYRIF